MSLDYVFGPVVATDTILNVNVQFHKVYDKQEKQHGWGWSADGVFGGNCSDGSYDIDVNSVVSDLADALCDEIYSRLEDDSDG